MKLKHICRLHGLLLYFLRHKEYDVLLKLSMTHICTVKHDMYKVAHFRFY